MKTMKPSDQDVKKLSGMLEELDRRMREGVDLSEKLNLTSHKRIFLHLISHLQAMRDSLE